MGDYLSVAEIETRLRAVETASPNACTVDVCPNKTSEGRSVVFARIGPAISDPARIPVLITGGVHGREWAPPDALVSFVEKLVATKGTDPARYSGFVQASWPGKPLAAPAATPVRYPPFSVAADAVKDIFDQLDIYVTPLINPDGRNFSRRPVPANRWWRKNRAATSAVGACVDAHGLDQNKGTDINRNFNIAWDIDAFYEPAYALARVLPYTTSTTCVGANAVDRIANERYRGDSAASEAETKNMVWLQEKGILYFVDVHSSGPTILYPWGIAENNQTTDRKKNFLNPDLNNSVMVVGKRDAAYAEYLPATLQARLVTIGGRMHDGIVQTQTMDSRLTADNGLSPKYRRLSAEYPVNQSAAGMYPTAGACDDFHFSRQFSAPAPSHDSVPVPPERVAFTIECGSEGQEGFWPSYDHEFPKIEREVHAALWSLLSYAAAPYHASGSSWPISVGP